MISFSIQDLLRLRGILAERIQTRGSGFHFSELTGDASLIWNQAVADLILSVAEHEASLVREAIQTPPAPSEPEITEVSPRNPMNMSVSEASEYLKVSVSTLYKWTSQATIPHRKVGLKKLSFLKEDLDRFLASHRVADRAEIERLASHMTADLMGKPSRFNNSFRRKR